jgi:hypothetical protein
VEDHQDAELLRALLDVPGDAPEPPPDADKADAHVLRSWQVVWTERA